MTRIHVTLTLEKVVDAVTVDPISFTLLGTTPQKITITSKDVTK